MEKYLLKIVTLSDAKKEIDRQKARGKRIVFTNGCFDILHSGHARYLYAARELGDYLIVAINSDISVKAIKDPGRPILPERERAETLAALEFVDSIVIFDEDNPLRVIQYLKPDVLVKGGDWDEDNIIGAESVKKSGGEVRRIPFIEGHSTTAIIDKILARYR